MCLAERLRRIRESKNLSQGDIEQRTGLLRCYISRVENGHTVPSIETLEKLARSLDLALWELLYDGDEPPAKPDQQNNGHSDWASHGPGARTFYKLRTALSRVSETDRKILLDFAAQMIRKRHGRF